MKGLKRFISSENFLFLVLSIFLYLCIFIFENILCKFVDFYLSFRIFILILAFIYVFYFIFYEFLIEIKSDKNRGKKAKKFFDIKYVFTLKTFIIKKLNIKKLDTKKLNKNKLNSKNLNTNKLYVNKLDTKKLNIKKLNIKKSYLDFINTIFILFFFFIFVFSILFETSNFLPYMFLKRDDLNNVSGLIIKITSSNKGYNQKDYFNGSIIGIGYNSKTNVLKLNSKCRIYTNGSNFVSKGDILFILTNKNYNDKSYNNKNTIFINNNFININKNFKNIKNEREFYNIKIRSSKTIYFSLTTLLKNNSLFFIQKSKKDNIYKIKRILFFYLNKKFNKWNACFLYSLITGDRRYLNQYIYDLYRNNQTSHLLALSGLHLGIIANFIFILLNVFIYNKRVKYIIVIIIIFIFSIFVEFPYSIIRAYIMFILIALILFYERKLNAVKLLFSIILFSFCIIGKEISSISFVLSISAIFSIFVIFPVLKNLFKKYLGFKSYIFDLFLISFSISLFQSVISLKYFKYLNILSFLINPFVIILVTISVYFFIFSLFIPVIPLFFTRISTIFLDLSHILNILFYNLTKEIFVVQLNIDKYFAVIILFLVVLFSFLNYMDKDYLNTVKDI